jgi:tRNA(fMet)-specific endonuclease VapC
MKVLLDTDTCIHLIRRRSPEIVQRIKRYTPGDIGISSITLAELSFGVAKSNQPEKNTTALNEFVMALDVAYFDDRAAWVYGRVRAALEKSGVAIGALDTLIGAQALSLGVALVTHNTREFSRVPALRLLDWIRE